MPNCLFCYQDAGAAEYHPRCSKKFFGTETVPVLELNDRMLDELASQTVNERIALTGVQPKLSLTLDRARQAGGPRFTIVGLWGEYILKPQHPDYPSMPETEDLTMHLAGDLGLPTCDHCLLRATDGKLVYIARRFDRKAEMKIHQEDLCQLMELQTVDKYKSSYERAGKLVRKYCTNTGLDALRYFELVLFSFLSGNNDMHLKNFSVMHLPGEVRLSPAYDLLNVNLVNPKDPEEMGLHMNGKKANLKLADFEKLAQSLQIPEKAMRNSFQRFSSRDRDVQKLIDASFLPADMKAQYQKIWRKKQVQLFGKGEGMGDDYPIF